MMILCPMAIEAKHVRRAAVCATHEGHLVIQTGIGKHAIIAAAARVIDSRATYHGSGEPCHAEPLHLILAGACGGLSPVDDVPPIARVIDEHGHSWTPANADPSGVTLIGVDTIIATPADKAALAARTGAAIVDMESHAFAAWCEERGVRWSIVRGVSDTPTETLPHEVLDWIAPSGDTRHLRAARDLVLKPWLIPHVLGVLLRSKRVLPKVGQRVVEVLRASSPAEITR